MRTPPAAMMVLAVLLVVLLPVSSAGAAPPPGSTDYATWTFTGTSTDYSGELGLAAGFPATAFTSTSRTPPSPPIASGSSVWLPAGTPFGEAFGSSQNQPYLNLRPRADNAGAPSATTYTFATPTPVGTWGFALGDVDAERLTVTATATDGTALSASELGFRGVFNYCDASPRSSSCAGRSAPFPLPTPAIGATHVELADPGCPTDPARCDTQGASGWFVPRVALRTLTITSTWRQGFPSYQTWFAAQRSTVSGDLSVACGTAAARTVQLLDGAGNVVGVTTTNASGGYEFPSVTRGVTYRVRVEPGTLPANDTAPDEQVEADRPAVTAPTLAVASSWAVRGHLSGVDTAGVRVALDASGGGVLVERTDSGGDYVFPAVPAGRYTVRPTVPAGEDVTPAERAIDVGCADLAVGPFTLAAAPTTPPPTTAPPTTPVTSSPGSSSSAGPSSTGRVSSTPSGTYSSGALAATGATTTPLVWAIALLALGGCVLLVARRPRRH